MMRVQNKKRLVVMLYNVLINIYRRENKITVDVGLAPSYDLLMELQKVLLHPSREQHADAHIVVENVNPATESLRTAPTPSFGHMRMGTAPCASLSTPFEGYPKVLIGGFGLCETCEALSITESSPPAPRSARRPLLQQP